MILQHDGALPPRREWWQTGNAVFFGLMALPMLALFAWGTKTLVLAVLSGSPPLDSPLIVVLLVIVQALILLIGLVLLFAAASQWQVDRQADWERRMNFVWVPVFLLMFAMLAVLAAMAPSALGLGLVALLGGILWWERPDEVKAWIARRLQAI